MKGADNGPSLIANLYNHPNAVGDCLRGDGVGVVQVVLAFAK